MRATAMAMGVCVGILAGCAVNPAGGVARAQPGAGGDPGYGDPNGAGATGAATSTTTTTTMTTAVSPTGGDAWVDGAPKQRQLAVGADGATHVGVWVTAPEETPGRAGARPPMAVSLVIDTSGSMSGEKIAHARMAAASLLESLRPGDQVSIYAFATGVEQVAAPTVVGPETIPGLMRRLPYLQASGSTNLYGGLAAGMAHMQSAPSGHSLRRVFVLSDGQANVGPSDPGSLGNLAAAGTEHGTQVTAIGVGLGYDESTLGALAVRSAGRLYHLAEPAQMASILERELELLAQTVANDAVVVILPAPGVRFLGVDSPGARLEGGRIVAPMGSLHAGQEREVLFRAQVDTSRPGDRPLAEARLEYRRPDGVGGRQRQTRRLAYGVTPDGALARRSLAPRVVAMVAHHEASQAQLAAVQALNVGDGQRAERDLARAAILLEEAAAAAPASPQRDELRRRSQRMRSNAGRARSAAGAGAAASRGAALEMNDEAMEALGY
ncbi:MAG TPA: VWA domain-containing protein [Polyangiaceae bacterium LLY-WYZ-14_1]|nr:VWA domain-containing protein [Polyangiaceae bacterium LLY-WYZ-14_1]